MLAGIAGGAGGYALNKYAKNLISRKNKPIH